MPSLSTACNRLFLTGILLSLVTVSCQIAGAGPDEGKTGRERVYFVRAEIVEWDYTNKTNHNQITGWSFDEEPENLNKAQKKLYEDQLVFVERGPNRIGPTYQKAVYREYTDETFQTPKPQLPEEEHLGILGPILRAEVGDTIAVHFRNDTGLPQSMHPHGVFYDKDSEGADHADGTKGQWKQDDMVMPGKTHKYIWHVPERAGPGPKDPSSVLWMYHSHVMAPYSTNAGLIGPIVITARGRADADGKPLDVDREFISLYTVFDENVSPYLEKNFKEYALGEDLTQDLREDDDFMESNLMHAINGYVYGNMPGQVMEAGERVRWYLIGMGTEVDLHTPHWHGHTVLHEGHRVDVLELLPASLKVADMVPDNPGVWLYHCHVNDHIIAGMQSIYAVTPLDPNVYEIVPAPVARATPR